MNDERDVSSPELDHLQQVIERKRGDLVEHPVYREIKGIGDLRWFMENHVYAVWDFMTLLKTLQRGLTSVDPIWRPVGRPATRRLINEIVMGEESDIDASGKVASHFEMYLDAMREIGASTNHIECFVERMIHGKSLGVAFEESDVPVPARGFVESTFAIIATGSLSAVAAAFTFGREEFDPGNVPISAS